MGVRYASNEQDSKKVDVWLDGWRDERKNGKTEK